MKRNYLYYCELHNQKKRFEKKPLFFSKRLYILKIVVFLRRRKSTPALPYFTIIQIIGQMETSYEIEDLRWIIVNDSGYAVAAFLWIDDAVEYFNQYAEDGYKIISIRYEK